MTFFLYTHPPIPSLSMRHFLIFIFVAFPLASAAPAVAQPSPDGALRIDWEVKNRFRLFRSEADFQRHVAAWRGDSILAAENRLEQRADGRGWARDVVGRLCVD